MLLAFFVSLTNFSRRRPLRELFSAAQIWEAANWPSDFPNVINSNNIN